MLSCPECNYGLIHSRVASKQDGHWHGVLLCTNCGACMEVEMTTIRKASPELIGKKSFEVGRVRRLVDRDTEER